MYKTFKKTLPALLTATLCAGSALSVGLVGATGKAGAQSIIDEVIVTAQKREQSLQDVGIAINAFSGERIKALNVEQSFDIANFTPGVHISGNLAGQNTQFTIRGVTQNDFNDIIEAPNAVYLDDAYIAVSQGQTFAAFDVARVEVLKGPQGTLFGRNATGGLVHYHSNRPSFDNYEGFVEVTYGDFDTEGSAEQVRVEGAINIPLSDKLAVRAAVMMNDQDPYLINRYPDAAVGGSPGDGAGADLGDDDTIAGRVTFAFEPSDTLRGRLAFNFAESELSTGPYQSKSTIGIFDSAGELINVINTPADETRYSIQLDANGNDVGGDIGTDQNNDGTFGNPEFPGLPTSRPLAGGDFFGYLDPDGDDFSFSGDNAFSDHGEVETSGTSLFLEKDLANGMTLTSVTDLKSFEKLLFIDVDSAPVNQTSNYAAVDTDTFSQELRLSGSSDALDWIVGFYYLDIDAKSKNGLKFPPNNVAAPVSFDLAVDAELETKSTSIFGQVEWAFQPQWKLVAGLRLMEEKKKAFVEQGEYATDSSFTVHQGPKTVYVAYNDEISDNLWTGKVQLEYTADNDALYYFGINRGVKAASYNAPIPGGLPVPNFTDALSYDEEILTSYEGGIKTPIFGGAAQLNASVFYYDYKDYQSFLFTGVSGLVINADAENQGAEIEISGSPMEGLDLIWGMSWMDATVKDVPLRVGGPYRQDVKPTYAPEQQMTFIARYEWQLGQGMMSMLGSYSYSDEYYYNLRNFAADKFDEYHLLNAKLGWQKEDGSLELAFSINNLTDERIGIQGFDLATLCGCNEVSYQPPRWYGLSARVNF